MFCSDPMSSSHFIAQTNKFLLIDATAVTLGQGHGKVRGKSSCGGGRGGRGGYGGNELKT